MALVTNLVRTQARRNALSNAAIRRTVAGGALDEFRPSGLWQIVQMALVEEEVFEAVN